MKEFTIKLRVAQCWIDDGFGENLDSVASTISDAIQGRLWGCTPDEVSVRVTSARTVKAPTHADE